MKELKEKIIELRKKVFIKEFCEEYDQEKEDALKKEVEQMMREESNKKELALFWNNQFGGRYDG